MSDVATVSGTESPDVTQKQNAPAADQKPGVPNPLEDRLTQLERKLNFLVTKETKSQKATEDHPKPTDTEGKIAELQRQLAENERKANDRIAAAELKDKHSALKSAIGPHGLGEAKAKILFNHIVAEHGSNIRIENGEVIYEDTVRGTRMTVSDLVAQSLTGPNGDMFKSAPGPGPETKGLGNTRQTQTTRKPLGEWTTEEVDALREKNRPLLVQYVREDRAAGL